MDEIEFFIEGDPVAQGRPRLSTRGNHARAYDPPRSKKWKQFVRMAATPFAPEIPWSEPIAAQLVFIFARPKARKKDQYMVTRPDLDNLEKAIYDSLEGLYYEDDKQISWQTAQKVYTQERHPEPGVKIRLMKRKGEDAGA